MLPHEGPSVADRGEEGGFFRRGVRRKKEPVRVGGARALRYSSLAPSEIVCESDLRPEIGFNCPKLEEEERYWYSNRPSAGL